MVNMNEETQPADLVAFNLAARILDGIRRVGVTKYDLERDAADLLQVLKDLAGIE